MRRLKICNGRRGQVWVETVLYTLIGLAVLGILLAVSKPKIDSIKDKLLIEQSIDSLNIIDEKISEVKGATGNKRIVDLEISKGKFFVDTVNEKIYWELDSKYQYSEAGVDVPVGDVVVRTEEGSDWKVIMTIDYSSEIDLTYDGQDGGVKEFEEAPAPYSLKIERVGGESGEVVVDFSE